MRSAGRSQRQPFTFVQTGVNPGSRVQAGPEQAVGLVGIAGQFLQVDIVARVLLILTQRLPPAVAVAVLTAHVTELRDRDCCSHGVLSGVEERTFSSGALGETQVGERVTK